MTRQILFGDTHSGRDVTSFQHQCGKPPLDQVDAVATHAATGILIQVVLRPAKFFRTQTIKAEPLNRETRGFGRERLCACVDACGGLQSDIGGFLATLSLFKFALGAAALLVGILRDSLCLRRNNSEKRETNKE